jgi:hypothetical protein
VSCSLNCSQYAFTDVRRLPSGVPRRGRAQARVAADISQQAISARLLDEIHLAPVLLKDGKQLFDQAGRAYRVGAHTRGGCPEEGDVSAVPRQAMRSTETTPTSRRIGVIQSAFRSIAYLRRLGRLDQKVQPLHTVEPWIGILLQRLLWIYAQLRKATQENAERDLRFQSG